MDAGELVSDAIVNAIVAERIDQQDCARGLRPRWLSAYARPGRCLQGRCWPERGSRLDVVIELAVDDKALVGRVLKRAEQAKAAGQPVRKDDNAEVFEERLREYYKKTAPLIGYYYAERKLKTADGMADVDSVTAQIETIFDSVKADEKVA